ncbi:DUF397 domain-containing protein [Streptomyces sp. NPDC093109]|uniref:DUF397 domain-containing protein n=1 Tax=Streptomyces sp. NPDC093109 TaxID=3154977 RepID=UPI00344B2456
MSNDHDLSAAVWRKSSYSNGDGGDCVEVTESFPDVVPVRDSKTPGCRALFFTAGSWTTFIDDVRSR